MAGSRPCHGSGRKLGVTPQCTRRVGNVSLTHISTGEPGNPGHRGALWPYPVLNLTWGAVGRLWEGVAVGSLLHMFPDPSTNKAWSFLILTHSGLHGNLPNSTSSSHWFGESLYWDLRFSLELGKNPQNQTSEVSVAWDGATGTGVGQPPFTGLDWKGCGLGAMDFVLGKEFCGLEHFSVLKTDCL